MNNKIYPTSECAVEIARVLSKYGISAMYIDEVLDRAKRIAESYEFVRIPEEEDRWTTKSGQFRGRT